MYDVGYEADDYSYMAIYKTVHGICIAQDTDYLNGGGRRLLRVNTESYIGTIGLDLFRSIDSSLPRQYFPEQSMSADDAAQQQRMQRSDDAIEQAVPRQTDQAQPSFFEDVTTNEDAHLVIVSTHGDPISAKRISVEARTSKWLGHMSDQSLQTLSQNRVDSYKFCSKQATRPSQRAECAVRG
ncbi:hypothetical protein V502_03374 [Pseudogymnoascus sp. VKM F-4520 (FW-2644)]|nr:hypothetical protein V502_03374 [Pseudogymnoascus sp. VKM F-4520 (FW-2644)]